MVILHIKRGDQSQFLYRTVINESIKKLCEELTAIFNGKLKINRICYEIEELIKYGPMYPPEILGLTEEQVEELKIIDPWENKIEPSGGWQYNKDPIGRRNGRQPNSAMQDILRKTIDDAKTMITNKLVMQNKEITFKEINEALNLLKGAVTIVYPMQLPPHDNIRMELTNCEDLSGTQAATEVIEPVKCELWFAGRHMLPDKQLCDYLGNNDKCKIIVKLVKCGEGAPGREPLYTEDVKKEIMLQQYRRQEELKKIDQDDNDEYLNSAWADNTNLKKQLHGLDNLKFRPNFK